jgi:hypothetical protein
MSQHPVSRHLAVGLAALLLFALPGEAGDIPNKPWHSSPDLSMGSEHVEVGGHCLRMSAAILDSSLAKLHKRRTANGTEFHRGKTVVDQFPEDLLVEVTVTDCVSPYAVSVDKEALRSVQFSAVWRRGNDERPSEVYVPRPRSEDAGVNDTFRSYELSIPSANVPLSDQLVLTVSAEGKKIAQFVGDL